MRSAAGHLVLFRSKEIFVGALLRRDFLTVGHLVLERYFEIGCWAPGFGALLPRDALAVAHHMFCFIEKFQGQVVRWWPSARREFRMMAQCISFMNVNFALPSATTIFASDAQEARELDSDDARAAVLWLWM